MQEGGFVGQVFGDRLVTGDGGLDVGRGDGGTEEGSVLGVGRAVSAGFFEKLVPGEERGAEGSTGVAGGGLDPDVLEGGFAQQATVGDAIEGNAAGEAEVARAGGGMEVAGHAQDDLLGDDLHGGGKVEFALGQLGFGAPGRSAEELGELVGRHGEALAVVEITLVEAEGSVVAQVQQVVANGVGVARLTVGRQAHEFVFAGVDPEAAEVGES